MAIIMLPPASLAQEQLAPSYKVLLGASEFICPPCYHHSDDDQKVFKHDGKSPVCGMNLIEKPDHRWDNEIRLHAGSGNFSLAGGSAHKAKFVTVFYHRPENFDADSRILMVLPGTGRNAWDYRDSWIEASELYNVLILSPSYAEKDFDFAAYHMGGVIENLELRNVQKAADGQPLKKYRMQDEDIIFDINPNSESWIFNDFDRIFEIAVAATNSLQTNYDLFGHSAGAQILHRLTLFMPQSKASKIVAANSGQYTLPVLGLDPIFGLRGMGIDKADLADTFATSLVLLVGENDNESETGGTMLHTPIVDQQGLGRLERAKYFFNISKREAANIDAKFNWQLEIVKDVGHDGERMGEAAAQFLYHD